MADADVDVLVAGGGPVGLVAAIEARQAGLTVAVVEPRPDPVDKACGEGLMPGALAGLRRLGVEPAGWDFHGIAWVGSGRRAEHRFRSGPGRGVRRTTLHAALAARADEAGVKRVTDRVVAVQQDGHGITAAGIRASWLLACDGLHSGLRRTLGLHAGSDGRRYGLRRHFGVAPWSDVVEVHWSAQAEAYVTPVAADVVGVAVLAPRGRPYEAALQDWPALLGCLGAAEALDGVRGAGPLQQRARRRVAGRVLLVGDAGGYVDALTGEGLRVGIAQARAAVGCLMAGVPEDYEARWRSATRDYRWLTSALVTATRARTVRERLVPAAASLPPVFGAGVERLAR